MTRSERVAIAAYNASWRLSCNPGEGDWDAEPDTIKDRWRIIAAAVCIAFVAGRGEEGEAR